ncbi:MULTISPECIES: MBL fold metallo-hydrolase [unclassified Streptomyces]|uniref:MBL fold metallo-hydrolase n=1 Tax=unclassified Streptomyces TaxID=2593676 RepID=UPI003317B6DB
MPVLAVAGRSDPLAPRESMAWWRGWTTGPFALRTVPRDHFFVRGREVADGVHAYVQPDGGWCLSNAGLLVAGGESLLIGTVATEARARTLREPVLRRAGRPLRLLVNTHFHGDHTFNNFVFPEALVVGHERAGEEAASAGST